MNIASTNIHGGIIDKYATTTPPVRCRVVYIIILCITILYCETINSSPFSFRKIISNNNRVLNGAAINYGLIDVLLFTGSEVKACQGNGLGINMQVFVPGARPHQYSVVHGRCIDGFLDGGEVACTVLFYGEDGGEEGRM